MTTTREISRWAGAEQHRDQLQAQLDRLDADPRVDADTDYRLREALDDAITDADDECEAAELAYWRLEGDDEKVAELEDQQLDRSMILASVYADEVDQVYEQLRVEAHGDTFDLVWQGREVGRIVVEDSDDQDAVDIDDALDTAKRKLAAQIVASPPDDQDQDDNGTDDLYIS